MESFLNSVASDLVASLVVASAAWFTRKVWLNGFYSDIVKVYKSQKRS